MNVHAHPTEVGERELLRDLVSLVMFNCRLTMVSQVLGPLDGLFLRSPKQNFIGGLCRTGGFSVAAMKANIYIYKLNAC